MKKHNKITKAVIAAAGYGTRFLPATKNQPKEMLPIIDKPIIQYLVEEAVESGITDIILVTRAGSHIMEDFFDNRYELEYALEKSGKTEALEMIENITKMANFIYVRQKKHLPYGNGAPLLTVKDLIDDDEAFAFYFGDDMTLNPGGKPVTKQLIDVYEKYKPSAVLAVQEVDWSEVNRYGVVEYKKNPEIPNLMARSVEKPKREDAPSNMSQFGRFIFNYDVIEMAQKTAEGVGGELWVTDMLNNLAQEGKNVIAQPIEGEWLTTGDPIRYLKTTLRFALQREDLRQDLIDYIQKDLKL